jgi:hypothetical protein
MRELVTRHLVARVLPAAVPDIIAATVLAVVPWALDEGLRVPSVQFVRGMRAELGELAKIEASLSVGETDRTKAAAQDASPLHNQTEVATFNGRLADGTDMVLGGCYRIGAQTAVGEADSAELMFTRMDGRNTTVREEVTRLLGTSAAAALPARGAVGLHKLAGGVIVSDNASAATATTREVIRRVGLDVAKNFPGGPEEFAKLSDDDKAKKVRVLGVNCFRHLPNTWLAGGEKKETELLKSLLATSLESLGLSEAEIDRARLTPGLNGVLRAASKEFGLGANTNAKGEGVKYWAPHCLETHPGELIIPLQRTEKGTRFDIMTRAANAIYFNVPRLMPFLDPVSRTKHILKDYLYAMLGCDENLACLRARCILDDKFTEPFLFFAASKELVDSNGNEWSVCDLAPLVDMTVTALQMGITTPASWMVPEYDIYAAVTHEAYAAWKQQRDELRAPSVDGTTRKDDTAYYVTRELRREIYAPAETTKERLQDTTEAGLVAWCTGMLDTLKNGNGARYCSGGGDIGADVQTTEMKEQCEDTCDNPPSPPPRARDFHAILISFHSGTGTPTSRVSRCSASSSTTRARPST